MKLLQKAAGEKVEGKVPSRPSSSPSVHEKKGEGRDERRGGIGGGDRRKKESFGTEN